MILSEKQKIIWVYIASFLFIGLNAVLLLNEFYLLSLLPLAVLFFGIALFHLDKLLLMVVLFTPLSVTLLGIGMDLPVDLYLPTEPMLIMAMVLFFLGLLKDKKFDVRVLKHPVSIAIYIYLGWIFVTSLTSTHPIISLKFLISRLWFIVGIFFLGTQLFKRSSNISRFTWLYTLPLIFVISYSLFQLMSYGMGNQHMAHLVMRPFFKDHTSYGAVIALFIPLLFCLSFKKGDPLLRSLLYKGMLFMLLSGLVFSYTRAAWVSLIPAVGLYLLLRFRVGFWVISTLSVLLIGLFLIFQGNIMMRLEKNTQDSDADLASHARSVTNISTDASNVERINRWKSAIRMFEEKPLFGWGPGTYVLEYAPFQLSKDRTIVSTNMGDLGNAHSEYLGPLAESGLPGMLSFLLIALLSIYYGIRVYLRTQSELLRTYLMGMLLGLVTYFTHGFLNNFLDTDKVAVPFWGFIAVIVTVDIYHRNKSDEELQAEN